MRFALAGLCVALSLPAQAAGGQNATPLIALVRGFYVPYLNDALGAQVPDPLDVIAPHATKHLRELIRRDEACEIRTHEVCDMDMDPIIDGQDWELNGKLPVIEVLRRSATSIVLVSSFTNSGTEVHVDYEFVKDNGQWLIDDIWQPGKSALDSWDIVTMLSEPD
jgi:hypothetical protein